jgi:protein required for attachment to host cells
LKQTKSLAETEKAHRVVLIAPARVLGFLRQYLDILVKEGIKVKELAKDISRLSSAEIQEFAAKERLLPARKSTAT